MTRQPAPPPWGDEPLSRFLYEAQFNERVSALNYSGPFTFLQRLHATYLKSCDAIEKGANEDSLLPGVLMIRAHSACLAGTRLALSGQGPEAHSVLRTAIEQAWYALHIAEDPTPFARADVWLRRDEGEEAKTRCKHEFSAGRVRRTHEKRDPVSARQAHELYKRTIDYGAHPNHFGVLAVMKRQEGSHSTTFLSALLAPDQLNTVFALQSAAHVGLAGLGVFRLVFPSRLELAGVDLEIESLRRDIDAVFKPFAQSRDTP